VIIIVNIQWSAMTRFGIRALLVGDTSRFDVLVEEAVKAAWKGRALLLSATPGAGGAIVADSSTVSRLSATAVLQLRSCRRLRRRLRFALARSPADLASLLVSIHTWRRQVVLEVLSFEDFVMPMLLIH
jgi:hypothetical protein